MGALRDQRAEAAGTQKVTQGSMEDTTNNRGTQGRSEGGWGWRPPNLGRRGGLEKGPPGPASPAPSLTSAYSALLLPSTSFYFRKQRIPAPRDGPATALRQSLKPVLRPPLGPRPRAASGGGARKAGAELRHVF